MPRPHLAPRMLAAAGLALAAGGCSIGRPPAGEELRQAAQPQVQALPPAWIGAPTSGPVANGWLAEFQDPALEKLVAEAVANNYDLRIAAARVELAAASARAAGAALLPQVNIGARGGGKLSGDGSGLEGVGLFANWELDLWGRVRAARASGTAQYEATQYDAMYARASIAALVAKSWFVAREATAQREIALQMSASAGALADLARDRLRVGKGDEYEAVQAEASQLTYRDLVLQADIARQNALRAIETLAGRYPTAALDPGTGLPPPPSVIPAGLPSELLERRPDVRAAERRVAAAFYRVHEAQAARLPKISLTASVSTISSELFFLKERDNPIWSVGASLLAPIFTGGALQAQVEARTAEQKAAIAEYGKVGARAFEEVENALAAAINLEQRQDVLARAVDANDRSVGFARVRFDVGSGDLRGVQQQLLALHAARTSYLHVQAERLVQRVNLYLALGGTFDIPPPPANESKGKESR